MEPLPDLTREEYQRYSRHLLLPEVGLTGQRRLKGARVLIVGLGGLGSPIALYLAAAGVGHLGLIDDDRVDSSNLQRQVIHGTSQLGALKVESARQRILDLNPNVTVVPHAATFSPDNGLKIAQDYDIVVDGADNFPTRYLANDVAIRLGLPYVFGAIYRFEGQCSLFHAAQGPCFRCVFPHPPPPDAAPSCGEGGVLGVLPGMIGTLQATEVLKWITGAGITLLGRLLLYDALEQSLHSIRLRKNPRCPGCGPDALRLEEIDYPAFCGIAGEAGPDWGITPAELARRLQSGERIHLIDVREPHELEIAAIPGAELVSLDQLINAAQTFGPGEPIVAYCRTGVRSARAVRLLRAAGLEQAQNLVGGINAWSRTVDPRLPEY